MRWLNMMLVASALVVSVGAAQAREEVITQTDPVTGVSTTTEVHSRDWHHRRWHHREALGSPVVVREFPTSAVVGQTFIRGGHNYRYNGSTWVILP